MNWRAWLCVASGLAVLCLKARVAHAQTTPADSVTSFAATAPSSPATSAPERWSSFLPLLSHLARDRGIELPLPFGAGLVLYSLHRDITITDVRVGRNGAPLTSVSDFASLEARADVFNLNAKLDAWILPFVNVYAIIGYVYNESDTRIDVTLPALSPGQPDRHRQVNVPTQMEGSVGGVGMTLAGGYGPYFLVVDINWAEAVLGFDERFKATVTSARAGWNGSAGQFPFRAWVNLTDWDTATTASGTVPDPDGGTLSFEVDQGPAWRRTWGLGAQCTFHPHFDTAVDLGVDFHGGWYLALVPVARF
jgi:hypothetical protein